MISWFDEDDFHDEHGIRIVNRIVIDDICISEIECREFCMKDIYMVYWLVTKKLLLSLLIYKYRKKAGAYLQEHWF